MADRGAGPFNKIQTLYRPFSRVQINMEGSLRKLEVHKQREWERCTATVQLPVADSVSL